MNDIEKRCLVSALTDAQADLLADWSGALRATTQQRGLTGEAELRTHCARFIELLVAALASGADVQAHAPAWQSVQAFLVDVSARRSRQGYSASQTAWFVLSLKQQLMLRLRAGNSDESAKIVWAVSALFDELGLLTIAESHAAREATISRQQQELLELSTPVVQLCEGVLAVPLIGTLDSVRAQIVMDSLLQGIVDHDALVAIIDITGVPVVDTLVAQHLLKAISAARLLGAECIISGIRPQIAQTMVELGVDLGTVVTRATLAGALAVGLERTGRRVGGTTACAA